VEIRSTKNPGSEMKRVALLVVFEILDLAKAPRRFLARFVRAAEIFSLFGKDFVASFYFFDHYRSLRSLLSASLLRHQYGLRCRQAW
jgi:hypothetical protein